MIAKDVLVGQYFIADNQVWVRVLNHKNESITIEPNGVELITVVDVFNGNIAQHNIMANREVFV